MIIESLWMPHLIHNIPEGGIPNQVFAVPRGRGYQMHALLEMTAWDDYWRLVNLGFRFSTQELDRTSYLLGVRRKGKMSLVGIPVKTWKQALDEIRHGQDRLHFRLTHQDPIPGPPRSQLAPVTDLRRL